MCEMEKKIEDALEEMTFTESWIGMILRITTKNKSIIFSNGEEWVECDGSWLCEKEYPEAYAALTKNHTEGYYSLLDNTNPVGSRVTQLPDWRNPLDEMRRLALKESNQKKVTRAKIASVQTESLRANSHYPITKDPNSHKKQRYMIRIK